MSIVVPRHVPVVSVGPQGTGAAPKWAADGDSSCGPIHPSSRRSAESLLKRALDLAGSALGLILLAPLFLVVALLVLTTSRGPAFYRQQRVGLDGRLFQIVKFRTMHRDADERLAALKANRDRPGVLFKLENDPRITPLGRFLRRYSIDELPQLVNVLMGDMSLVGPRPALPCEVDRYCERALGRLEAVPGMTGAWQVGGRSTLTWPESLDIDLAYIADWSVRADLGILCATVRAVVRPIGAY